MRRREGLPGVSVGQVKGWSPDIQIEKSPKQVIRASWSSPMLRVETSIQLEKGADEHNKLRTRNFEDDLH